MSIWAYTYELLDKSLVSDHRFDTECYLIDPKVSTGHPQLDAFFRTHFEPCTGSWVHDHPEKAKLAQLAGRLIRGRI